MQFLGSFASESTGLPFGETSLASDVKCYNPDGSAAFSPDFQPWGSISGATSMCCATSRPPDEVDICKMNGLCHNLRATGGNGKSEK